MARQVLIIVVAVIAIILGVIQIMRGLHLLSPKPAATSSREDRWVAPQLEMGKAGHFHLRVPKGWEKKDLEQGGIMWSAPQSSGLLANLIVTHDKFRGSLRQYVDATVTAVKASSAAAQKVSDAPFTIDIGGGGYKIVLRNKIKDVDLIQTIYFFEDDPNSQITITTSTSAAHANELGPLFDQCVKALDGGY